ncbi:helix-turn-helix domain-containing protein [Nocardia sp. ET3-3]|uniref:Helix-turn-helix domain-containing protein n=2 Tax=Nocardia terrae TaxID=2675851 RepID=A0A7K1V9D2_9NOCA|nr:helix-turn-helix domain-containing protein [Nocardia terrae]
MSHMVDHHRVGFTCLWIDPYYWAIPQRPSMRGLGRRTVDRLLAAVDVADPDRLRGLLRGEFDPPAPVDPRLRLALESLETTTDLDELADLTGVSPRRLRQLSAAALGGPLTRLRGWYRLREAGLLLPFEPAAEVAVRTGFADQAHMIRTSVALCGRTPGSSPARRAPGRTLVGNR